MPVELKKEIWECPGEAHEKDMCFNPSTQDVYGEGAHYCDVCDGEYYVSYRVYAEELAHQEHMKEWMRLRKIQIEEQKEQQKLIDKIMTLPKSNVNNGVS